MNRQTDMTENITFLHYVAIGNKSHFGKKKIATRGTFNWSYDCYVDSYNEKRGTNQPDKW